MMADQLALPAVPLNNNFVNTVQWAHLSRILAASNQVLTAIEKRDCSLPIFYFKPQKGTPFSNTTKPSATT